MQNQALLNTAYLVAAVLFILGLKAQTHPRSAGRGALTSALGMLVAVVATLLHRNIVDYRAIFAGLLIGGAIGAVMAFKVRMTGMPQLVALFNGFGGAASALVAGAALIEAVGRGTLPGPAMAVATAASGLIGSLTFWGSLVAFAKLQEVVISGRAVIFQGQKTVNVFLALATLGAAALMVLNPAHFTLFWAVVAGGALLGILLTIPIGGADMPVVVALLNSYSGLAAAATGFVLGNIVLIIAGALVGASGLILTSIMCRAMNRSLVQVLFGVLTPAEGGATADEVYAGKVKSTSAEEVAMLLDGIGSVVIVPGYGMAVSQAQHAVRDFANLLESRGADVTFAIHPVAGRMPGHMNVLLAEADVPYEKLREMDEVNPGMEQVEMAIVIGANDVVNPLARSGEDSPIAGMPVIDVDKARTVVVIKRSLSPGFAGLPNPLFAADNVLMLFSDGKKAFLDLVSALKESIGRAA